MKKSSHRQHRIVISGLGIVCAAGRTTDRVWQSLNTDRQIAESASIEASCAKQRGCADFSGTIDDFGELPDAKRKLIRKSLKVMNRETQLGVAAGQQALLDSGALDGYPPERFGVIFGSDNVSIMPDDFVRAIRACSTDGEYDINRWGSEGIEEMAPLWLLKCLPNMPACHLAIINDLQGPSNTITQRDLSAHLAIAEACRGIRTGDSDAVLVGATGTTLSAFNLIHAQLDHEVEDAGAVCRPFDQRRSGPAPGEGAAAFVLEDLDAAVQRGARIYGEILSTAAATSIAPGGAGCCRTAAGRAIRQVLAQSGQTPESIGHLHAHGLGTTRSDIDEAQAVRDTFGTVADCLPIVAARSAMSHTAAAAGALQLVSSLLAVQAGHLFPIRNFRDLDPDCPVHPVVSSDEPAGDSFLSLSIVGRGLASCMAVRNWAA